MNKILLLVTTESDEKKARNIAKTLVENNLAACVSIKPIHSVYKWQDKIEEASEFEITIKSKPEFQNNLIDYLQKISSYKVPQIIFRKFYSESNFHDWLSKSI